MQVDTVVRFVCVWENIGGHSSREGSLDGIQGA